MRRAVIETEKMAHMVSDPSSTSLESAAAFQQRNNAEFAKILNTAATGMPAIHTGPMSPSSAEAHSPVVPQQVNGKKRGRPAPPVEDGKKKRKAREPKDPDAPKRPASAYILFQNDVRKAMTLRYPDMPYKELLIEISREWAGLDPAKKAVSSAFCLSAEEDADVLFAAIPREGGER